MRRWSSGGHKARAASSGSVPAASDPLSPRRRSGTCCRARGHEVGEVTAGRKAALWLAGPHDPEIRPHGQPDSPDVGGAGSALHSPGAHPRGSPAPTPPGSCRSRAAGPRGSGLILPTPGDLTPGRPFHTARPLGVMGGAVQGALGLALPWLPEHRQGRQHREARGCPAGSGADGSPGAGGNPRAKGLHSSRPCSAGP